ncbi:MAG: zinc metalloprotease, partial [Bacteroidetes bacterium]
MKKSFAVFLALLTLSLNGFSQIAICGTDHMHQQLKQQYPALVAEEEKANEQTRAMVNQLTAKGAVGKKAGVIVIPVVFHVIHNDGMENITQAQIMDQIRIINEDFRKKSGTNGAASTNPLAVDMEYEFRLAQLDPNGNRHDGINRVKSTLTEEARNNVKSLSRWPSTRYLNIWVVKSIASSVGSGEGTVLGFAQFPSSMAFQSSTDGIVIRADYVGTIQTGNGSGAGRTLTHEIGHWIGLYHTFQNGCVGNTQATCSFQGDQVCDTPPVQDATFGCLTSRNSCTNDVPDNNDQIENYMDYMDGKCANVYTPGQKERSIAQMELYRANIYSTSNLAACGINPDGSYINVAASSIKVPYSYGFEDADVTTAGWRIQNLNNGANAWKVDAVAYSGSKSMGFRNFSLSPILNSRDEFSSPLLDLSTLANPLLTFRVAYARKSASSNDVFDVGISGDFGRTETRIFRGTASNIETPAGAMATELVPTTQGEWKTITVDLTPYKNMTNARIRFELA